MLKKIGLIILIVFVISGIYFGLQAKFLINSLEQNNKLIKEQLNNKDLTWFQFNWDDLNKYLVSINPQWQKIFRVIPFLRQEIEFQENIKQLIKVNNDIKNGVLIKNILTNNQEYLTQLSLLIQLQKYFNDYHLGLVDAFFNDFKYWVNFLGFDQEKHYLILYQVPTISRPTGGLITAYSILNLNRGVKAITFDNILSLDDLVINKIIPPEPLRFVNNRWLFHDINWFFDFPQSAKKILDWYNQMNIFPSIDGVIIVNTSVIRDLMDIVKINQNLSLNDINNIFIKGLTDSMAYTNSQTNKEILLALMNNFIRQIQNQAPNTLISLEKEIIQRANTKDIEVYFNDDQLEYYFDNLNLTGKILASHNDYLAVVFNNLSPVFKTNDSVKNIYLTTDFTTSTITNTLIIKENPKPNNLESYLKIYLPLNIKIIETQGIYLKQLPNKINYEKFGFLKDEEIEKIEQNKILNNNFEIFNENDKTVIAGWAKPSITSVKIVYQLPFNVVDINKWQLIIQKQSGANEMINYNIILPADKKLKPTLFQFNKLLTLTNDMEINFEFESND